MHGMNTLIAERLERLSDIFALRNTTQKEDEVGCLANL